MTLKICGSSIKEEYVYCSICGRRFIWLNAYSNGDGIYRAICRQCRLKEMKNE